MPAAVVEEGEGEGEEAGLVYTLREGLDEVLVVLVTPPVPSAGQVCHLSPHTLNWARCLFCKVSICYTKAMIPMSWCRQTFIVLI